MATRKKTAKPGDQTGRKKVQLQAEHAKEQKEAAARMATATIEAEKVKDEVVDYTAPATAPAREPEFVELDGSPEVMEDVDPVVAAVVAQAKKQPAATQVGGVEDVTPTLVQDEKVKVVALADLPRCTIGAGNVYSFEEGRKYVVPRNVFEFLGQRGYLREA